MRWQGVGRWLQPALGQQAARAADGGGGLASGGAAPAAGAAAAAKPRSGRLPLEESHAHAQGERAPAAEGWAAQNGHSSSERALSCVGSGSSPLGAIKRQKSALLGVRDGKVPPGTEPCSARASRKPE